MKSASLRYVLFSMLGVLVFAVVMIPTMFVFQTLRLELTFDAGYETTAGRNSMAYFACWFVCSTALHWALFRVGIRSREAALQAHCTALESAPTAERFLPQNASAGPMLWKRSTTRFSLLVAITTQLVFLAALTLLMNDGRNWMWMTLLGLTVVLLTGFVLLITSRVRSASRRFLAVETERTRNGLSNELQTTPS